jgi:DNA-binding NarL/FixJ family response regulator
MSVKTAARYEQGMSEKATCVLIVAQRGPLQEGLQALMTAIPLVQCIEKVDSAALALSKIDRHRPALVLLDTFLPDDELWPLLQRIKTEWPQTLCVVLINEDRQRARAQEAGADAVQPTGYPAARLAAAIEGLLLTGDV